MNIDISKKVAIITGAARGIGLRLAQRFAEEGARVAMVDRDETVRNVASTVAGSRAYVCDVGIEAQVAQMFAAVQRDFGSVDILVNNAGVALAGSAEDMTVEAWDETFASNVRAVFLCTRAAAPVMRKQRWGRIINASSFAAIIPSYAFAAYASSKAAVVSMTRVFASELGPHGVTVNAYAPGMVPTEMNRFAEMPPERQQALLNTLSLRRWESADDVANVVIFLASEQAGYVTGALIDVSGGKFATQFPQAAYQAAGL
jgi:3-oxoacyl-[acyl-carrier protein] reductase